MEFLLALQFLTMIPVTVKGNVEQKHLARSMAYFSLIGLILGLLAAGVYTLLSWVVAPALGDLFTIAFLVIITGNMHGDGLMDTADGLYSGKPRERILEIMKDSRVGSHGVMAGILTLLAKIILLGQLADPVKIFALVAFPVMGRWAQVFGAALYPYARATGGIGTFTDDVGIRELSWVSITALAVAVGLFALKGLILAGAVLLGTAASARYISRKLGGLTGDTYGTMNELAEILFLVMITILFK